jgi:hypothetical protein
LSLFKEVKISKTEAFRVAAISRALKMHNYRTDLTRDTEKVIADAKRIYQYLTQGT